MKTNKILEVQCINEITLCHKNKLLTLLENPAAYRYKFILLHEFLVITALFLPQAFF